MKHVFWLILILVGCSSPKLRIQSEPSGAKVYMALQGAKERKEVGVTPLDLTYRELVEKVGAVDNGEYYVMTLELKDVEAEPALVPTTSFGAKQVTVKVQMHPKQDVKTASVILQRLHNAQKFAQAGEIQRAHGEVDRALEFDPFFVRSISMKASLFYLQKNFQEAARWYEKALTVDSSFDEAIQMLARIKKEHP